MKELITVMPYVEMRSNTRNGPRWFNSNRFVFISNHWDVHLHGICKYNSKLCEFKTENYDSEYISSIVIEIYRLSFLEKVKWLYRKKLFELCVGSHWSYPQKLDNCSYSCKTKFKRMLVNWFYNRKEKRS